MFSLKRICILYEYKYVINLQKTKRQQFGIILQKNVVYVSSAFNP